ncbi:carboxypeptidase-like regulatory domain-containing protein [Hymenobacter sp. BT491]|uniref:carboxypeptidase-like regulatory domain-containing protein n=1 Tax=Hymenobacter sp. BT491 TaxID=2766779 RepID=UPI001653B15F|nr:carboxypeptidase-like regulatory domain-containing protein [Hymenobacter sp. BT491]MBC6989903.1 carboxypeptidase regulatory-like domain-containing protein [Hymenobacter sp. BT491]
MQGQLVSSQLDRDIQGVTILVKQDSIVVRGASTDKTGAFRVEGLHPGIYSLALLLVGYRTETVESVSVSKDTITSLTIPYPGPCKYIYPNGALPACVDGHKDHFIPIAYGFPGKRTMKKAKLGEVHLGGCQISGCDPKYYCPIHNKQL